MFKLLGVKKKVPKEISAKKKDEFHEERHFNDYVFVRMDNNRRTCGLTEKGLAYFESFDTSIEVIQHLQTFCIGAIGGKSVINVQNNMVLCEYGEYLAFQFMARAFSITYFKLMPKGEFKGNGVDIPDAVIEDGNGFPAKVFKDAGD